MTICTREMEDNSMKTCNNCGKQNNDEDMFCEQCGAALSMNPDDQQQTAGYTQNADAYQTQAAAQQMPPQTPYPMLQILKKRGGSALFLVAVICMTVQLVANLIESFGGGSSIIELQNLLYQYGIPVDLSDLGGVATSFSVFSLIALIPTILVVIGLWMIFVNCRKQDNSPLSTAGFSLVRGVLIFEFVCFIVILALGLLLVIFAGIAGGSYLSQASHGFVNASYGTYSLDSTSDAVAAGIAGVLIGLLIGMIIALVLGIVYYVKVIGSLKRAQEIVRTGSTMKNVSAFVGVINIIGAVFSLISGLIALNIGTIIGGVTSLLFGILIMSVRKEFGAVLFMQNQQNFMR